MAAATRRLYNRYMRVPRARVRSDMPSSRSPAGRPPTSLGRRALAVLLLALAGASAGTAAAPLQFDRFRVAYQVPEDPHHRPIYRELRAARLLEEVRGVLAFVRLPRTVTLALVECDGDANAYYDPDDLSVSVCYEYVDDLRRLAAGPGRPPGVTPHGAVHSKLLEIFLHEAAHALIDLRRIPVIGGQEEAADVFANVVLLQLTQRAVRETMLGIAWMYGEEARDEAHAAKTLADSHPLAGQRYYNCLCLAYGAKPRVFAELVRDDVLPAGRAQTCGDEYRRAAYAVGKLMGPYLGAAQRDRVQLAWANGTRAAPREASATGAIRSAPRGARRTVLGH